MWTGTELLTHGSAPITLWASTNSALRQPLALRIFSCLLLGAVAVLLAAGGSAAARPWTVAGPIAGALQAILTIRYWRQAVLSSPDGLTVRNVLRTYNLSRMR